jgi:hypothetical protein
LVRRAGPFGPCQGRDTSTGTNDQFCMKAFQQIPLTTKRVQPGTARTWSGSDSVGENARWRCRRRIPAKTDVQISLALAELCWPGQ